MTFKSLSKSGFTLIESIMVIGGISLIGLTASAIVQNKVLLDRKVIIQDTLVHHRADLILILSDSDAVKNMIDDVSNTSMECLRNGTPCAAGGGPLRVRDNKNEILGSTATATSGITLLGRTCNGYGVNDSGNCLFRIEVHWVPKCTPLPCVPNQIALQARFLNPPTEKEGIRDRFSFEIISNFAPPVSRAEILDAGIDASCAVRADKTLWCWGGGYNGVISGMPLSSSSPLPVQAIKSDGTPLTDVTQLAVGNEQVCVRTEDGQALCVGENNYGQLGIGRPPQCYFVGVPPVPVLTFTNRFMPMMDPTGSAPLSNVVRVLNGENSNCAITSDRKIFCAGENRSGAMWQGSDRTANYFSERYYNVPPCGLPTPPFLDDLSFSRTTELRSLTDPFTGLSGTIPPDWTDFYFGTDVACLLVGPNKELSCWGIQNGGRLASNTPGIAPPNQVRRIPEVGHSRAINVNATVPPEVNRNLRNVTSFESIGSASCAVTGAQNRVVCWGTDAYEVPTSVHGGPTGVALTSPTEIQKQGGGIIIDARSVTVGWSSACATTINGEVYCWGKNNHCQLGVCGAPAYSAVAMRINLPGRAIHTAVGWHHACSLMSDRKVFCWGNNLRGQLGTGSLTPVQSAVPLEVQGL